MSGVRLLISDNHAGMKAAREARFPGVPWQRCQFHLAQNLFDHLPPNVSQPEASADLRAVFNAPNRAEADRLLGLMVAKYEPVAKKLAAWLEANVPEGLTVFDFPAEHWDHLRTSNPIESVFATVRHRTVRTKGALSTKTAKLMVFKLVTAAAKTWRRLKGENQLPKVVKGVKFQNGIEVIEMPAHHAA